VSREVMLYGKRKACRLPLLWSLSYNPEGVETYQDSGHAAYSLVQIVQEEVHAKEPETGAGSERCCWS